MFYKGKLAIYVKREVVGRYKEGLLVGHNVVPSHEDTMLTWIRVLSSTPSPPSIAVPPISSDQRAATEEHVSKEGRNDSGVK